MTFARTMLTAGCLILVTGCSGKEIRDGVCQGIYDGVRIENRKEMSPRELATKPEMDYQQYTKERKMRENDGREMEP